ncbi:MAG: DUF2628 domain-containing protein [Deltaproteobacteria bacterium]|nr:DUF2628 domain-containing protein [Deltaproteobacteria bacterium]
MKRYTVYKHPSQGIEAIKTGFSWPALFFGIIWLIIKKLWMITALWIIIFISLIIIATFTHETGSVFLNIILLGNIALLLLPGFKGNDWLIYKLKRRGYRYISSIEAESPEAAIEQVTKCA